MPLEVIKLVVRAIVAERDESGQITGEHTTEPAPIYTVGQLHDYYATLLAGVEEQNAAAAAEKAAAEPPNRAARRSRSRAKK